MKNTTLLILTLFAAQLLSGVPQVAPAKGACSDLIKFIKDHGETIENTCPETIPEKDRFYVNDDDRQKRINNRPKPLYEIEYLDPCSFGLERFRGCSQNPDALPCEDGSSPYTRIIRFVEGPRNGEQIITNGLCPEQETPPDLPNAELREQQIIVTPSKFRSFPIAASMLKSEPTKFSLRNGHSHFWAVSGVQNFRINMSGRPVAVKAIPVRWNWNYGDGNTRNLDFPGEPAPEHTLRDETPTSHSYTETGTYGVGLTTLFRGEFSVDGGPWQAIPGQAAVPSEPIEIDVWRTKKQLIATD
ncbi:hypothetical protein [Arthrobacter sp. MYb224]|uniref:hypothetical protein n=1 Tax=Arthrobacter sp. MYb224 TaxID=1848600 RepID=UPI0011B0AB68|nr:hypothetical protein [Arthrobacter sp. MYb224]